MGMKLNPITGKFDKVVDDHSKLKNIGASDHHTKYTDAEAISANDDPLYHFKWLSPAIFYTWKNTDLMTQTNTGTASQSLRLLFLYLLTGATSGSKALIYSTHSLWVAQNSAWVSIMGFSLSLRNLAINQEGFYGRTNTHDLPAATDKAVGVRIIDTAGTTYFYAVTSDASGRTQTEIGHWTSGLIDTRIVIVYDLTEVRFYSSGVLVATHTTNIPINTSLYFTFVQQNNQAAEADVWVSGWQFKLGLT